MLLRAAEAYYIGHESKSTQRKTMDYIIKSPRGALVEISESRMAVGYDRAERFLGIP